MFVAVGAGLIAARHGPALGSAGWFSIGVGACALALATRGHACRAALLAAVAACAGGWFVLRIREAPPDRLDRVAPGGSVVCVEGVVLGTPRPIVRPRDGVASFLRRPPRARFDADLSALLDADNRRDVQGRVWVVCDGEPPPVRAGDRVRIVGRFSPPEPPLNPGEPDLREHAAQGGFAGLIEVPGASAVRPAPGPVSLAGGARSALLRGLAAWRDRARTVVLRCAGDDPRDPSRALLLGLVLGEYDESAGRIRDSFARTGLVHVLSISGFHFAVMAWVALAAVRLTGDRGFLEPLIVAALVLAYAAVVPPASPIVRSGAMVLGLLAGEAIGRRHDRVTLLIWIGVGLLAWRPLDLWSLGFQLSLGLTGLLLWTGEALHARLWGVPIVTDRPRPRTLPARLAGSLKGAVSAGLLCVVVSAPVLAWRVGLVSPLSLAACVLVTPIIVVVLWLAYGALMAGLVVPGAAEAAGHVLRFLASVATRAVEWIDTVPFSSVRVPPVSWVWAAGATAVALYWVRRGTWRDARGWCAAGIVVAWMVVGWAGAGRLSPGVALRVDMFAVGDGSCCLLRAPGGAVLWDCAPTESGGVMPEIVRACRELGAWRVATVVVTHPDLDHFGGLPDLVEPLGVRRVIVTERFVSQAGERRAGAAAWLLEELSRRGVEVVAAKAGDTLALGEGSITFLFPPAGAPFTLDNDTSLVALVEGRGDGTHRPRVLMTGDVQDEAIAAMTRAHAIPRPDVLELPHHGSARPAAVEWAGRLDPRLVMQSTGPSRVGDRRWAIVRAGRAWYTTAVDGAAWAEVARDGTLRHGSVRAGP